MALAGCGGQAHHTARPATSAQDQRFLSLVDRNSTLAGEPPSTLVDLGHATCDLLDEHAGNATQVDADMAAMGGKGGAAFFSPSVMAELRADAATVYCPRFA